MADPLTPQERKDLAQARLAESVASILNTGRAIGRGIVYAFLGVVQKLAEALAALPLLPDETEPFSLCTRCVAGASSEIRGPS